MQWPGLPSLLFLTLLFVLLPYAAWRSTLRLRPPQSAGQRGPEISREQVWANSVINCVFLFFLAWAVGWTFGFEIFAIPRLGLRELAASLLALAGCFVVRAILRASRTEAERRKLMVYRLAARTPREFLLWIATSISAGIAEEAAYRGVAMSILWYSLGNPWIAAFLCATAFAVTHCLQGWKSVLAIFAIALVMHALVLFTETLVLAMIVHASYDLIAGYLIAIQARKFDAMPPSP